MTPEQIATRILPPGWRERDKDTYLDRIAQAIDDEETRREISAETLLTRIFAAQHNHHPRSRW